MNISAKPLEHDKASDSAQSNKTVLIVVAVTQVAVTQVAVTQVAVTQVAVTQVAVTQVAVTQVVGAAAGILVADTQAVGAAAGILVADTQAVGAAAAITDQVATTEDGSLILPQVSQSNPLIMMKQLTEQGFMVADLLASHVSVRVNPLRQI
jgi:hypothetical protein